MQAVTDNEDGEDDELPCV